MSDESEVLAESKRSSAAESKSDADAEVLRASVSSSTALMVASDGGGSTAVTAPEASPASAHRTRLSIALIMTNELCERFSFYGLRAILPTFFNSYLLFTEDVSTALFHAFTVLCYSFPLAGGFLSDRFLGKFWTIFIVSIIYVIGAAMLSVSAIPGLMGAPGSVNPALSLVALFTIAVGTGGIKPCVSSLVGDQFVPGQEKYYGLVFPMLYFFINLGSLLSTFLTPYIQATLDYDVAFAVPAILLAVAVIVFAIGKRLYRIVPPGANMFYEMFVVLRSGFRTLWLVGLCCRCRRGRCCGGRRTVLGVAAREFGHARVSSVRAILRVLTIFAPMPLFWALFDQHSSTWVFQAGHMDLQVGSVLLRKTQIPAVNPMMTLLMIPVFRFVLYPLFGKCFAVTPLRRMGAGMILAAISFILTAVVEMWITSSATPISVLWQLPQYFVLTCAEILVSITGLEFAYTQVPKECKSVVQGFWLLTTAAGNLLVAAIAEVDVGTDFPAGKFFLYAGMMFVFAIGFIIRAYFFQYYNADEPIAGEESEDDSLTSA